MDCAGLMCSRDCLFVQRTVWQGVGEDSRVEETAMWSCVQICVCSCVLGVHVVSVVETSSVVEWFSRSLGAQCRDSRGGLREPGWQRFSVK